MATRAAPIVSENTRLKLNKPWVLRFYQHFSLPDVDRVRARDTYFTEYAFASREEFDQAMAKPGKMIETCRQDLLLNAAYNHHKGLVVRDLVVSFDGKTGFEIEAMDARHVGMALRKHDAQVLSKPEDTCQRLKKAWKVSQDERYPAVLHEQFMEVMQHLRPRTELLGNLVYRPEAEIVDRFGLVAPIWATHEKGYGEVEQFFFRLADQAKFDAHRLCLEAWAKEIHAKPNRFYKSFDIISMVGVGDHLRTHNEVPLSNPTIQANASFELINTYLALDPEQCLAEGTDRLSGTWRASLGDPVYRDAAVAALLSGYARHQRIGMTRNSEAPRPGFEGQTSPDKVSKVFFNRVAASAGVDFQGLLDEMVDCGEDTSKAIGLYYAGEVDWMGTPGRYDLKIPTAISRIMPIIHCPEMLSLALKARLLSTKTHESICAKRFVEDQDAQYFGLVITNPNTSLKQIKAVVADDFIQRDHFKQLANTRFGMDYVAQMPQDSRRNHISKGNIPASLLSDESDLAMLLEVDMGL